MPVRLYSRPSNDRRFPLIVAALAYLSLPKISSAQ
jgi:hypothetical protein